MSVTMLQSCRAYNVPRGSRLFIRKKKDVFRLILKKVKRFIFSLNDFDIQMHILSL